MGHSICLSALWPAVKPTSQASACLVIHAVTELTGVAHLFIYVLVYDPHGLISTTLPFDFYLFRSLAASSSGEVFGSFAFLVRVPLLIWSSYTDSLLLVVLLKDLPGTFHPQTCMQPEQLTAPTTPPLGVQDPGDQHSVTRRETELTPRRYFC